MHDAETTPLKRGIREIQEEDVEQVINYFVQADDNFLKGMGVDPDKLPDPADWQALILDDLSQPLARRQFYYLVWLINGRPAGHSNINKIVYGDHAYMHLHLWNPASRQAGNGLFFIQACITAYFDRFDLDTLFCEPYALNPAPNRILAKTGFDFVRSYETTPGWINFHQKVNSWTLSRETWQQICKKNRM